MLSPSRSIQPAPTRPAMTCQGATAELLPRLPEPAGSALPARMGSTGQACEDGYQAAVARAQAIRKRQAEAAHWLIARVVNSCGLAVRALENEAMITNPGHRGNSPVRIRYAGGAVYCNGAYLGILDGYEPSGGRRVGREEILAALRG